MSTIRFARLSFEKKFSHYADERDEIERRRENLLEVINFETDVNSLLQGTESQNLIDRGNYAFAGIETNGQFISGKIGKEREDQRKIKDEEIRDYVTEESEDADISFFVIDLENSVMAYEYVRNVGEKAPFRIIRDTFNSFHDGFEELSISLLVDKDEVSEELDKLVHIEALYLTNLHPTNPDSTNHSQNMDEFLRNGGIDNLNLDAKGDDVKLRETPLLDSGLGLAEEGYGTATVKGEDKNGDELKVSTDDKPIEAEVEIGESTEVNKAKLLDEIETILNRIKGQSQ